MTAKKRVRLKIKNRKGSPQHYFHFLLGFLVPLSNYVFRAKPSVVGRQFVVQSCGALDKILMSLPFDVEIFDPTHEENGIDEILFGFDAPPFYDRAVFEFVKLKFLDLLENEIRNETENFSKFFSRDENKVVFINRGDPDPFYATDKAKKKSAGSQRRSIQNFAEIANKFKNSNVFACQLEGMSLTQQIALFNLADVIIAQHGGALANLIWAKEGTSVIEILPATKRRPHHFYLLARCLNQKYYSIKQKHEHAEVDTAQLFSLIDNLNKADRSWLSAFTLAMRRLTSRVAQRLHWIIRHVYLCLAFLRN